QLVCMGRLAEPAGSKPEQHHERWSELIINPDPEIRRSTAARLGAQKDERALPAISWRLRDPDVNVRRDPAWGIGEIGDAQGAVSSYARMYVPAGRQLETLMGADPGARQNAAARLIPALARAAADSDAGVRVEAVRSLGRIGNAKAIPALVKSL